MPGDKGQLLAERVLRHFLNRSMDEDGDPAVRAYYAQAYAGLCQVAALDRLRLALERLAPPAASRPSDPPDPPEAREFLSAHRRRP